MLSHALHRTLTLFAAAVITAITAAAPAAGILAPTDQTLPPLRVTDHLVSTEITDQVARTTLTQTFHNDTNQRLEATYVFPLPENADLTDFRMTFNGKMVEGEVLPAAQARQIYESIVRQSRDPGLIEFIGRRLLQMRVFPIEPGSDTTIKVSYQQICRPISGMSGFHYPLRTRKTSGQAYGTVRFEVKLSSTAPLKTIWSPSHAVEIVRKGEGEALVAYEAQGGSLEDDFLLLYDTDASDLGLSVIAHQPDETKPGHFLLILTPKQLWPQESYQPQDVVFVIDTSGSMANDKIKQAKSALKYCVDRLDDRDRFSIVRFSTGFDVLFDDVAPANAGNRQKAHDMIDGFKAAGGTNIGDTMQQVMRMRPAADDGRPYVVVFLTDGRGNREADEILTMLKAEAPNASNVRVFPFGVGHDVNTQLLDQMANRLAGRPTYVQPGEDLELVLGDFFGVISQPVLTRLKLSLPEIGVTERFPPVLADLYKGQQLIVAAQFANGTSGPVRLTAMRGGTQVEFVWPNVDFTHTATADYVPAVWAGRKLAYLIDEVREHGESPEMLEEIIALSTKYGIQTPYTSWLVAPEGRPQLAWRSRGRDVQLGVPAEGFSGGMGGGGGFGGAAPGREVAQERLRRAAGESVFGAPDVQLQEAEIVDMFFLEEGLKSNTGQAATVLADRMAKMKSADTRDLSRVNADALARREIGGLWYSRIGGLLVDERFDEDTELTLVKFGSDAYFELVGREDLRAALAANRLVVVMVADDEALVVTDDAGVETFSNDERNRFGLPAK